MDWRVVMTAVPIAVSLTWGATWPVGPQGTYKNPREVAGKVADGDTVLIDAGVYSNEQCTWSKNRLTLRGTSPFAHVKAPSSISNQKAIWVIQGNDIVVENIEFSDASVPDQNGAGIRAEGKNLTIRGCSFHDNENGILGGSGHVRIEYTEFNHNGYGDGYSHNMYISNCDTFTLQYCHSHRARIGHEVKSRAKVNIIRYNRLMNEADGTASYTIDLPNGGTSFIIGNAIHQGPNTDNSTMVNYGAEGLSNPGKDLYLVNNTLINDRSAGTFVRVAGGASEAKTVNNLFIGEGTTISGPHTEAGNLTGSATDIVSRSGYDYHLTAGSVAIGKGVDPGTAGGISLTPVWEYRDHRARVARSAIDGLDVGAFEYGTQSTVQGSAFRTGRAARPGTGVARLSLVQNRGRGVPRISRGTVEYTVSGVVLMQRIQSPAKGGVR